MPNERTEQSTLPEDDQMVSCKKCMKSVPQSEAKVSEAEDYVAYFCGLECYDKWVQQKNADTDK